MAGASGKYLPDPDHGQGVELAVFVELLAELFFALCGGFRGHGFLIGQLRHVAVLHAVEVIVAKFRAKGWQDGFDAPASMLAWVVVVAAGDRQQVHQSGGDGEELWSEVGGGIGKVSNDAGLKARVVGEARPLGATEADEFDGAVL